MVQNVLETILTSMSYYTCYDLLIIILILAIRGGMLPCALRPLVLGTCATLFLVEFIGLVLAAACFQTCLAPK